MSAAAVTAMVVRRLARRSTTTTVSSSSRGFRTSAAARGNPGDPGKLWCCCCCWCCGFDLFSFFSFPEEKTSLIIINVCCVVFFSLAPKRRIHPRERNVRDQRHFVAETYLRDGHRGWRRVWGEHSHFCGELSTSKRRMMCSRNFFVPTTLEREREKEKEYVVA